jgi:hypothetical protein
MPELFDLGIDKSAVSIVQRYGGAAPEMIAAEAVELLEARDCYGEVALKQILKDVEDLLAERESARKQVAADRA